MAGSANSIVARNVLRGRLSEDNLIAGGVGTAFNPAYALVDEAGNQIVLYINSSNYQFYAELKDKSGNHISNSNIIDLPLESMVVDGSYDAETKEVVLVLNNGNEVRFSVADLVEGLVSTEQLNSILTSYVKFTDYATTSKTGVIRASSAYGTSVGPSDGIMSANVKAYNDYPSSSNNMFISKGTLENVIAGKNLETANNKVTSVSPSSTDTQYPTAKLFYDTQKTQDDEIEELQEDAFGDAETTNSGDLVVLENTLEGALDIELGGNTSQEAVAAVVGTEVINTSIGATDVDNTKENHITLKGNTSQFTTTGKNLYAFGDYTITNQTYYFANKRLLNNFENNTTYTLSFDIVSSKTPFGYSVGYGDDTTYKADLIEGGYSHTTNGHYSITFTTNNTTYSNLWFRVPRFQSEGTSWNATVTNIQLEKGSTATAFEPYTGAKASPNPDYPQDIQVVSGNNNIEICGKNLFDKSKEVNSTFTDSITTALNNYKSTGKYAIGYFDLGTKISNNVDFITSFTPCQSGTTYTIKNTYPGNFSMAGFIDDSGNVIDHNSSWSSNAYTHTATSEEKYIICGMKINVDGIDYRDYVQIEKGSTATTYQAYSGNNYSVNLPVENLFDKDNANILDATIDSSTLEISSSNAYKLLYISCKPNTTYTISKVASNYCDLYTTSSIPNIGGAALQKVSGTSPFTTNTITTKANTNYLIVRFYRINDTLTPQEILNSIQIEKGPKANSYIPYGTTPIELCKISDNHQDKIFKSNNEWYLHKEIGKVVFDGSENWDTDSVFYYTSKYGQIFKDLPWADKLLTVCDYAKFKETSTPTTEFVIKSSGAGWPEFSKYTFNTANDFKTWLLTHNITTYYGLTTPVDTKITDATLISQLDALYTAQLKNGITNISTEANDLLPYIDLKYNMTIASPSPEKPSDIHVVTGNNTVTVCGKNLSPVNYKTISGTTGSSSTIGGFGGSVLVKNIPIEKNTKYFITGDKPTEVNSLSIFFYNGEMNATIHNGAYTEIVTGGRGIQTYPIPTGNDNTNYEYMAISAGNYSTYPASTAVTIAFSNIMIRKEGTSEDYEPYQSQTYPINLGSTELCKLGSYQDKIIKPTGKNLFDPSSFVTKNNVSINTNEVLTATSVAGTAWGYSNRNWTGILPAGIYTLTMFASQVDTDAAASIRVYNSGGNELLNFGGLNNIKNKSMILNLVEETTIGIMFKMSARGIWTFQIEKGPTATEYEPCSISNWFFKKAIYKVIFDGSENWGIATRYDNLTHYFNANNIVPMPAITTSQITNGEVCNKFTMQNPYTQIGNYFWIFQNAGATVVRIGFDNETITSSADFKTWLSNNNTTCYYPLETTTYTKITDTTLIGQLDAIANARSYKEFTNISQVNTDLPFELAATAFLDTAQGREAEIEQSKQDKLTPGANIKIENNVISAYDVVRTNGVDHIYGNKTFEYYPTTNATTPTSNNQLINKGWVDSQLSEKVGFTDYATGSTGGVIKTTPTFATDMYQGFLYAQSKSYSDYTSGNDAMFISKKTLENVMVGKDLTTKAYVDGLVGDVETLLETLDTGSGV